VRLSQQLASGRYKLELTSADASIPVTSLTFTAGWFAAGDLDTPEMLDIALDKASYKAGDTARVTIDARGKGRALVAVLGRGLALTREVEVAGKSTEVAFPVDESWSPGAYVAAIMYRPMDEAARRMPGRSIGLKWLETDKASRTLGVTLTAPEKVASGAKLTIPVRITGARSGSEARVVVSAVDLGILNLTRYEAPSPEKHFLAQRLLSSEIRDLYGRLIDGMQADRGRIRSGGDGGGGMAIEGSTQAETSLALFSGVVTPGPDGIARVTFDLPQFNGTARLTAVAWSADKVGSAKADVIVRDPVAVTVTAPRFLTLGDEARMTVDVHNVEGQAGGYKVAVDAGSSNIGGRELQLSANERKPALVTLKASVLGKTSYAVRVTGPGGVDVARTIELDVKPPAGEVRRVTVSTLKARGGRLTLTPDLMTDMLTAKAKVAVTIGPAAALDVAGLVVALDRYPYGCAEQTTSKAMPLVYLDEVAKLAGLGRQEDVKERVTKAIARLLEMQDNTGAFGIWGAGGNDMWLTAYVTDFLTRAKEAGYPIPPRPFTQALDRLRNTVSSYADFEKGGEDLAYALYVLARNGRAPVGDLRYYADTRIDRFATPLARTQIGAALAMLGDRERADRSFASTMRMLDGKETETYRSDYGSMLRDGAAMLTLVSETGMAKAEAPRLAALVERALATRDHTSTQENAWMLLAARSMIEAGARMRLEVAGKAHKGHFARTYGRDDLGSGVAIANPGDEDVRAVVTVSGDAATPEPPVSKGFSIERLYYTLDGKPVDLASATGGDAKLVQNQRLVVVLKVTPAEGMEGRLLIVDRLPAGLEIENPRLLDSASAKSIPWLSGALTSEHAEFRDDRFVAAVSPHGENAKKPIALAYTVRAISPGRYLHPAATVEDMYRPQRFARTASGRLEVTAKE
jgi:hypothetical protein